MSDGSYVPDRGDVIRIEFNPQAGHEQTGNRPALVISPAEYNGKVGLALVMPITGQTKGYPFEVPIAATRLGQLDNETLNAAVGRVLVLIDPDCEFTSGEATAS